MSPKKLLILDFCRRWRATMVFIALLSYFVAMVGVLMSIVCAGGLALIFQRVQKDQENGVMDIIRIQPVSQRDQWIAMWVVHVPLRWLVILLPQLLGNWVGNRLQGHDDLPSRNPWPDLGHSWLHLGLLAWMSLGFFALNFLLMQGSVKHVGSMWGKICQVSGQLLVCFGLIACPLCLAFWPENLAAVRPWQWGCFYAAPVLVLLSLWTVWRTRAGSGFVSVERTLGSSPAASFFIPRLQSIPLQFVATFVAMAAAYFVIVVINLLSDLRDRSLSGSKEEVIRISYFMASVVVGMSVWRGVDMRLIRTLPLSAGKITAWLLAPRLIAGVLAAVLSACRDYWTGQPIGVLKLVALMVQVTGYSALVQAVIFGSEAREDKTGLVGRVMLVMVFAHFLNAPASRPAWGILMGLLVLVCAFLAHRRTLRISSELYRPDRLSRLAGRDTVG